MAVAAFDIGLALGRQIGVSDVAALAVNFVSETLLVKDGQSGFKKLDTLAPDVSTQLVRNLVQAFERSEVADLSDVNDVINTDTPEHRFERFKKHARREIDAFLAAYLEINPELGRILTAANTEPGVRENLQQGASYRDTLLTDVDIKTALGDLVRPRVIPGQNCAREAVMLTGVGGNPQFLTERLRDIQGQLASSGAQPEQVTRVGIPVNLGNGHWNAGIFEFHGSNLASAALVDSMSQATGAPAFREALAPFNLQPQQIHIEATGKQSAAQNYTHCGDYAMHRIVRELGANQHPLSRADDNPEALRAATVEAIIQNRPELAPQLPVQQPLITASAQTIDSARFVLPLQAVLPVKEDASVVMQNFFGIIASASPVAESSVAAPAVVSAPVVNAKAFVSSLLEDKQAVAPLASEVDMFTALVAEQTRAFQAFHSSAAFKEFKKAGHDTSFDK